MSIYHDAERKNRLIFLYIIGAIILLLVFARLGSQGLGCLFILIVGFVLWRLGVLSFIFRIISSIFKAIMKQLAKLYYRIGGDEDTATSYLIEAGRMFLS